MFRVGCVASIRLQGVVIDGLGFFFFLIISGFRCRCGCATLGCDTGCGGGLSGYWWLISRYGYVASVWCGCLSWVAFLGGTPRVTQG
jgi:hypothetical protein